MDSGLNQKRMNANCDRLSSLPDDLIHKIFSSSDIKHVIETSVLSSRWRYIWTSLPYLNFSSNDFPSLLKFSKFVTHVLSCRNNEVDVSSVKLSFRGKASQVFVNRILKYAFSHNVQQMTITCLVQKKIEFPCSFFTFHSLKHLTLSGANRYIPITLTSSTWELPAVTTLHLNFITFDDVITDRCRGLFSKCTNLKNLTLNNCNLLGSDSFSICHPQLCSLTFVTENWALKVVDVVAPQLKTLSLVFSFYDSLQFISDGLPSLEKVDLCISSLYMTDHHKIVGLLQQFHSVKFLTLNLEIVKALTSALKLISNQPSPFANLKSLKIYPVNVHSTTDAKLEMNVSTIIKKYLLDGSPGAMLTRVSHEEMRAESNAVSAENYMEELRVRLYQEKTNTSRARRKTPDQSDKEMMHEQGKEKVENHPEQPVTKMPLHIEGRMVQIQSCWDSLSRGFRLEKDKVYSIFSELQRIEQLMKELPASKRIKLQTCFSSLCAEADIVMNTLIDRMKIHCETKINRLIT